MPSPGLILGALRLLAEFPPPFVSRHRLPLRSSAARPSNTASQFLPRCLNIAAPRCYLPTDPAHDDYRPLEIAPGTLQPRALASTLPASAYESVPYFSDFAGRE
ncbi:hypothetical protein VTJ04DRAFT_9722 [Mycothermus thermophilus]|uniref:uncharacterized protein n=1 Tax=Humicola insolens TaxID=85995 RepID=UPI0037425B51